MGEDIEGEEIMWPFKANRKKKEPELKPPVAVGERFKYLGITMVCSRHWEFPYDFPVVVAEYVNKSGEIKHATFCPTDWRSLKSENKRK